MGRNNASSTGREGQKGGVAHTRRQGRNPRRLLQRPKKHHASIECASRRGLGREGGLVGVTMTLVQYILTSAPVSRWETNKKLWPVPISRPVLRPPARERLLGVGLGRLGSLAREPATPRWSACRSDTTRQLLATFWLGHAAWAAITGALPIATHQRDGSRHLPGRTFSPARPACRDLKTSGSCVLVGWRDLKTI